MPHSLRVRLKNLQRKGELTEKDIDRIFKALEQEPCEDAISRQAVQDYIAKYLSQYLYDDVRGAVEVIDEYIAELSPVNPQELKWIPVSERLPEIDEPVLIFQRYYSGANITIGRYHSDEDQGGYRYWQWIKYDNHFSYGIDNFGIICPDSYYVDAWMPLPQPYKADKEIKHNG